MATTEPESGIAAAERELVARATGGDDAARLGDN
jgi:hypothetical protein